MPQGSKHETSLVRVMIFGTGLSFGVLAAIIASMKDFFGGNASFEFSWVTVLAFVLGFAAGIVFWWVFRKWINKPGSRL